MDSSLPGWSSCRDFSTPRASMPLTTACEALQAAGSPGGCEQPQRQPERPLIETISGGEKKSPTKLSSRVTSTSEHKECAQMKYMAEKTITDPDCNCSGYLPLNLPKHVQKCIISDISSSSQGLARGETLSFSYRR